MDVSRIKAVIAYDGSKFQGFQRQSPEREAAEGPSITGRIEETLASIGIREEILGAGRTDAGVHATGQVIAFNVPGYWNDRAKLVREMNRKLHPHVHVKHAATVPADFHPRYHARKRLYRYIIQEGPLNIFAHDYVTFVEKFDPVRALAALKVFEGTHDFALFRKTGSDEKTTVRTMYAAGLYRHKNVWVLTYLADAFLRSQIRLMSEAVIRNAAGTADPEQIRRQLAGTEASFRKPASPSGLYLAKIYYSSTC